MAITTANRKASRSISDVTKFDCQCGHEDCEPILQRKLKALAQRKESLLSPLNSKTTISNAYSPLPALFRRMSLLHNHTRSEAKQYGKVKKIFFSPHPDDVAYSCFGLASSASKTSFSRSNSNSSSDSESVATPKDSYEEENSVNDANIVVTPPSPNLPFSQSTLFSALSKDPPPFQQEEEEQENWIVTVFSKSRCANGLIGQQLGHCVQKTSEYRQREDKAFAESINAKLISLDLRDTSARDEGSRHPELLASSQSSLSSLSVNHPKFEYVKQRIRPYVEWAIECKATIHIPVAVGCHIDHWMVRVAILSILYELEQQNRWIQWSETHYERSIDRNELDVQAQKDDLFRRFSVSQNSPSTNKMMKRLGSQLIFYEDLPYAFLGTDDAIERTVSNFLPKHVRTQLIPMTDADWNRKVAAVRGYASQIKPDLIGHLHDHALLLAKRAITIDESWINAPKSWTKAERSWVLDDICGSSGTLLTSLASHSLDEGRRSSRVATKKDVQTIQQEKSQLTSNTTLPRMPVQPLKPRIQFQSPFDEHAADKEYNGLDAQLLSPRTKPYRLEDGTSFQATPFFQLERTINPRARMHGLSASPAEVL